MFAIHMSEEAYNEILDEQSYIPETFCPDGWRESALADARAEEMNMLMQDQLDAEQYWIEFGTMNMTQLELYLPKPIDPNDIMF